MFHMSLLYLKGSLKTQREKVVGAKQKTQQTHRFISYPVIRQSSDGKRPKPGLSVVKIKNLPTL